MPGGGVSELLVTRVITFLEKDFWIDARSLLRICTKPLNCKTTVTSARRGSRSKRQAEPALQGYQFHKAGIQVGYFVKGYVTLNIQLVAAAKKKYAELETDILE